MNNGTRNYNGRMYLRYLFLTLVYIFSLTLGFTYISWAQEKDEAFYERMCGPLSLSILCEMLGQKVHPETIADMTGARDENGKIRADGTSMKELANVAYLLGFNAVGMKMNLQHLKKLGKPAIAHTTKNGRNHFLVVDRVIKDKFRLIEVDETTQLMSHDDFSKIWNGSILVISKTPQVETGKRPNVEVKDVLYDFGYAKHLQTITHNFELKNIGSLPLEILQVGSSCACSVALLSEKTVQPNQIAKIQVTFETKLNRGRQTATIKVRTNDPVTPVIHFTLTGVVAGLARIVPNNIYIKNINNKEEIRKTIEVYNSGSSKFRIKNVTSSSPYITTKLQPIYKDGIAAKIFVTIKTGIPFGDFNEKLTILTEGYDYPMVEVLVRGKVAQPISLTPDQFFMGFVKKGEVLQRSAKLRKVGTADLKIEKIESSHKSITTKFKETKVGQEYDIEVTFTTPTTETGNLKTSIKIHTNDIHQPLLEVPFYAIIK